MSLLSGEGISFYENSKPGFLSAMKLIYHVTLYQFNALKSPVPIWALKRISCS